MVRKLLSLILLVSVSMASAAEVLKINPLAVRTPGLSGIELLYGEGHFAVVKDGQLSAVNQADVDAEIRNLNSDELHSFIGMGKFLVKQFDNGDYSVKEAGGLDGGGPGLAFITNLTVRTVGYVASIALATLPGGQGPALATWHITESVAMVATSAAFVAPTF